MGSIGRRIHIDDICSLNFTNMLCSLSLNTIQQKEVGGYDDLHPLEVIETADPDVDWAAKGGMPSSMVRCYRTLWF
jgi:hypothetical protein